MSEYIIDWDENLVIDTFSKNSLREEIVRCKGCKHYERMNDDEGMCMVPDDDGDYVRWMVDADGYCYLGEKKR